MAITLSYSEICNLKNINRISDIINLYGTKSKEVLFIINHFKKAISYCSETGNFNWKINYSNNRHKRKIGDLLFGKCGNGSVQIRYDNFLIYGHQLAFLLEKGYIPKEIDHINGIGDDNRIENLRDVTHSINDRNKSLRIDNYTKIVGVSYDTTREKWMVSITELNGKRMQKRFSDFFEACCYRKSLELINGYHINHGRNKLI